MTSYRLFSIEKAEDSFNNEINVFVKGQLTGHLILEYNNLYMWYMEQLNKNPPRKKYIHLFLLKMKFYNKN